MVKAKDINININGKKIIYSEDVCVSVCYIRMGDKDVRVEIKIENIKINNDATREVANIYFDDVLVSSMFNKIIAEDYVFYLKIRERIFDLIEKNEEFF